MTPGEHAQQTATVPELWAQPVKIAGNSVRQLLMPAMTASLQDSQPDASDTLKGRTLTGVYGSWPVVDGSVEKLDGGAVLMLTEAAQEPVWMGKARLAEPEVVLESWKGAFHFGEPDAEGALRSPQVGAVHAAVGHILSSNDEPGLIVMPTGTGKTESMLAIAVHERVAHLLVLVPTAALREQIAAKFLTLGILQREGVVKPAALRPAVAELARGISSVEDARALLAATQVVVATPDSLRVCSPEAKDVLLEGSSHLFVDEAHHAPAATWQAAIARFPGRRVLLFTATPHRRDKQGLRGRQIYRYSLAAAQQAGYYREIAYSAIVSLNEADRLIATAAVERLGRDRQAGFDHLIMARVSSVPRTAQILPVYEQLAPELAPVVIHSQLGAKAKRAAVEALRSRSSRIIICVDMLGEGFDMPQLKIAALHDSRKSLSPLIQLVGRFTRTAQDSELGTPSVFAARDAQSALSPLSELYREDADWNAIMRDESERLTIEAERTAEFDRSFHANGEALPTSTLRPTVSAIAFRAASSSWDPAAGPSVFEAADAEVSVLTVGDEGNVAWFVVSRLDTVPWSSSAQMEDATHELVVMRFDPERRLLFIHGSEKSSKFEELAEAVLQGPGELLHEAVAFRVLSGLGYPVPTNVGLVDLIDGDNRFSMHTGGDVSAGLRVQDTGTKSQTHIALKGFADGERTVISAARSGRIWSPRTARSVQEWVQWCDEQGDKLLDTSIDVADVIKGFVVPEPLRQMPEETLLAVEWPALVYESLTALPDIEREGRVYSLLELDLLALPAAPGEPKRLALVHQSADETQQWQLEYTLSARDRGLHVTADQADAVVRLARGDEAPFARWLGDHPPTLVLAGDVLVLDGRQVLRAKDTPAFDRERLVALAWPGVNLKVESQGKEKRTDSIQYLAARELRATRQFDVLLDDDGTGEVADLVGLRVHEGRLIVTLVHCKYAAGDDPGARVADLYEVCGQAVRSIRRRKRVGLMLELLSKRAGDKLERGFEPFEVGDAAALVRVCEQAGQLRPQFEVIIVQPGLAKSKVRDDQLPVLAGVASYLQHTAGAPLSILVSQ
jgi:superfamily II DNA or RNA helicase